MAEASRQQQAAQHDRRLEELGKVSDLPDILDERNPVLCGGNGGRCETIVGAVLDSDYGPVLWMLAYSPRDRRWQQLDELTNGRGPAGRSSAEVVARILTFPHPYPVVAAGCWRHALQHGGNRRGIKCDELWRLVSGAKPGAKIQLPVQRIEHHEWYRAPKRSE